MKILLLSAYDGTSHRYWREGLVSAFPEYQWTQCTLPGRYFNWRIRGNPLSWLHSAPEQLEGDYELIVATSMVDLATIKGLFRNLAAVPSLSYFHENQFAYPQQGDLQRRLEPCMVNLYSALASDRILFNSNHNRSTFFEGADLLMKQLPDYRPRPVSALMIDKSVVVPVPLKDDLFEFNADAERSSDRLTLVWNHRWEHDKGPEYLYRALQEMKKRKVDFELHLLGEGFRQNPAEFEQIKKEFVDNLGSFGFLPSRDDYYRTLSRAHLALSTSLHEFQGLAVMEAVALGAMPVVPDRLSYPELFPTCARYRSEPDNPSLEASSMVDLIQKLDERRRKGEAVRKPEMNMYRWSKLRLRYQKVFEDAVGASS